MGEYLYELSKGWVWVTVGEISNTIHYGYSASASQEVTGVKLLRITDIQNNSVNWDAVPYCTIDEIKKSQYLLKEGDLVFARTGATVGKSYLIRSYIPQAVFASYLIRIILFNDISKKFIYNFFQSNNYWLQINEGKLGIGQPNVNAQVLSKITLPLPPLGEQYRIVAKIEELFTQLDAGVELLKKVKAKLKRYRQAVLKAAVEGNLTKEWRTAHQGELEPASVLLERILKQRREKWEAEQLAKMQAQGKTPKNDSWKLKYKEPVAPDTSNLPDLPDGWCWANTQQIGEVQLGRQRSPKNRSKDYPTKYIRAANLTEKGLNLSDVLDMEFEPHERERYLLKDGDILLSEASGSPDQVGKPAIWRGQLPECCFQNTVIRLSSINFLSNDYLLIVFKTFYLIGIFSKIAAGVGINHLSANKFSIIAVPISPFKEQIQIVKEVDRLFSIIDQLEKTVDTNIKRAERLRQSILKQAFTGQLVPQDPSDEPAEKLLERIKAEKAKQVTTKTKKKTKTQPKSAAQLALPLD
ncbi:MULTISPECIES: restriction endonuclease subunit S [Cyanophyceae]|uniref:restriction endonuclease subunit S n=1 Tax=Cyanophyceae TaxID=3028117 RepID=UPI00232AB8D3|nr:MULTISPECIES: restriction endonuclease subunit S [Cyanophyceae]MDB9357887.1 restriction endonuclease subunit S [Nodularia spumigena CS-587/03]MDB9317832.1 restriction endonuclease subunit S [Nodularia spumigena CS-590/01A]MDB9323586.1 restriction endonuclease subunit S [Nodularia spumigena CS-591/07A]MDB9326844.1 restriction endonuclease subunit S [Nodularia spumigena CS-590/02]MDB9331531.1 restriction endonuclease subunit S [Nodularia spumigena CS-591/04]